MITYIATKNSQLVGIPIHFEALVETCVKETRNQLLKRPEITVFGKKCRQPRDVGFYSDESVGYKYSGKLMQSMPLSPALRELLLTVNELLGGDFNGLLINAYVDGNDCVGKHSDDEAGLSNVGVACLSYGATRKFRIRNKSDGDHILDVQTGSNYMIVMQGDFQKEFTHEIPIEKKIKTERISITFRKHLI